jgi:hypothetical protein
MLAWLLDLNKEPTLYKKAALKGWLFFVCALFTVYEDL